MGKNESRKTIHTFAIASFLNDLGSDMIYPVWPLFVTTVLNANMAVLGLIDGLGDAIVSLSQAGSGYLSDKLKRRKVFIWMGYLLGSFSRLGYALSSAWQHLIPFRVLDRLGKIRSAPRDAIVADVSTRKNRGRNFGLLRAMDNLGAVCGIVCCVLLFSYLGYRKLFLLASIPSLVSASLVFFFIKERKSGKIHRGLSLRDLTPNFKLFLLSSSLFALGFFSYSFLLIYAKELGFQTTFVPVLYLTFTLVASLTSLYFGKLADVLRRKFVLGLSYILFTLTCFGFLHIKSFFGILILFVFYGLHLAARMPAQTAFVSELAPKKYKASTLGMFQMIIGLCSLPASLMAGILWTNFGSTAPFYFSIFLTFLALVLLVFVKEQEHSED